MMRPFSFPSLNKHRKITGPKEIKLDRLHDSANSL